MQLWFGFRLTLLALTVWLITVTAERQRHNDGWTVELPARSRPRSLDTIGASTAISHSGASDLARPYSSPTRVLQVRLLRKPTRSVMRKRWWLKDRGQSQIWLSLRTKGTLGSRRVQPLTCTPWTKASVPAGELGSGLLCAPGPPHARRWRFTSARCFGCATYTSRSLRVLHLAVMRCAAPHHSQQHYTLHPPPHQVLLPCCGRRGSLAHESAGALPLNRVLSSCWVKRSEGSMGVTTLVGLQQSPLDSILTPSLCLGLLPCGARSPLSGSRCVCRLITTGSPHHLCRTWTASPFRICSSLVTSLHPRFALSCRLPLASLHEVHASIGSLTSRSEIMRTRGSRGGRRDRRRKRPRDVERESGRPPRWARRAQASVDVPAADEGRVLSSSSASSDDAPRSRPLAVYGSSHPAASSAARERPVEASTSPLMARSVVTVATGADGVAAAERLEAPFGPESLRRELPPDQFLAMAATLGRPYAAPRPENLPAPSQPSTSLVAETSPSVSLPARRYWPAGSRPPSVKPTEAARGSAMRSAPISKPSVAYERGCVSVVEPARVLAKPTPQVRGRGRPVTDASEATATATGTARTPLATEDAQGSMREDVAASAPPEPEPPVTECGTEATVAEPGTTGRITDGPAPPETTQVTNVGHRTVEHAPSQTAVDSQAFDQGVPDEEEEDDELRFLLRRGDLPVQVSVLTGFPAGVAPLVRDPQTRRIRVIRRKGHRLTHGGLVIAEDDSAPVYLDTLSGFARRESTSHSRPSAAEMYMQGWGCDRFRLGLCVSLLEPCAWCCCIAACPLPLPLLCDPWSHSASIRSCCAPRESAGPPWRPGTCGPTGPTASTGVVGLSRGFDLQTEKEGHCLSQAHPRGKSQPPLSCRQGGFAFCNFQAPAHDPTWRFASRSASGYVPLLHRNRRFQRRHPWFAVLSRRQRRMRLRPLRRLRASGTSNLLSPTCPERRSSGRAPKAVRGDNTTWGIRNTSDASATCPPRPSVHPAAACLSLHAPATHGTPHTHSVEPDMTSRSLHCTAGLSTTSGPPGPKSRGSHCD